MGTTDHLGRSLLLLLLAGCGQSGVLVVDTGGVGGAEGGDVGGDPGGDAGGDDAGDDGGGDPEGACGLGVELDSADFDEGDLVSFEVVCTEELSLATMDLDIQGAPRGSDFEDGVFTWQTDGADAGGVELLVTATKPSGEGLPESVAVKLWVNDQEGVDGAEPVDPTTYTFEYGLPVMHVDMHGSLSSNYEDATVWFQGKEYTASAKIRGASSAYYTKPGYMLEFNDDELDVPGWGPGDRDHLALLTLFDDNSYVRQKLVYDQWTAMAEYWGEQRLTPRTFYVVVYLDGRYHGLYVGLDRADNEFVRDMGFDDTGNMYKAVSHDANFYLSSAYGGPKSSLASGYEKTEGDPEDDYSDLISLVNFTGSASDSWLVSSADSWFDVDEFMDWFLLVTYTLAEDSAGKNAYLYHDPTSGLWRYAPWDFNHSWGQNWYTLRIGVTSINEFQSTNRIFKAFQAVPDADEALWDRFRAMRQDGPYHPDWFTSQLDGYYAEIDRSAVKDWDKWGGAYRSYSGWSSSRNGYGDWTDYEGEKAYLYKWAEDRAEVYADRVPD